jgi:hypothetical protein
MNGPGFYKSVGDGQSVYYAPNSVTGPGFSLVATQQATYIYPVNGWTWFADENTARATLLLPQISAPTQLTFQQFLGLFTPTEQVAIINSADPNVKLLILQATANNGVTLSDAVVVAGVDYLASAGLLTSARAAMVLANTPHA